MRRIASVLFMCLAVMATAACAPRAISAHLTPEASAAASPISPAIAPSEGTSFDPSTAPAGDYALDPRHTSVLWRVRHLGLGLYTARFDVAAGELNFDPAAPENSTLSVTIAAGAVSTGLLNAEGERAFDREIASLLGADAHPEIAFVSRAVTRTGPTTGLITGDLTMNGQTHPATFEARFQGTRTTAILNNRRGLAFAARTIIDRRQWGVGNLLFDQFAGDEVEILIDAEFIKS